MIWGRQFSLLFVWLLLAGCASGPPAKPDIPASVSPGWKLSSLNKSALPAGVPSAGSPECWKADYAGPGSAEVWTCWYKVAGNAFEAVQRTHAEAQRVTFQEGQYLIVVKWNNASKPDLTALIRALQKALQPAH